MNEKGDFAYVVPGTLRLWLTKRNPTFVRGDGNRCGYKNMVDH